MSDNRQKELTELGLLAMTPFMLAVVGVWLSPFLLPGSVAFDLREFALIYGAVVVSYFAGLGAGGILAKSAATREPLLPGMVAAVVAWIAALPVGAAGIALPEPIRFLFLIGALAYLLMRDLRAVSEGLLPAWFGTLRLRLTFWAAISLAMIMARMLI